MQSRSPQAQARMRRSHSLSQKAITGRPKYEYVTVTSDPCLDDSYHPQIASDSAWLGRGHARQVSLGLDALGGHKEFDTELGLEGLGMLRGDYRFERAAIVQELNRTLSQHLTSPSDHLSPGVSTRHATSRPPIGVPAAEARASQTLQPNTDSNRDLSRISGLSQALTSLTPLKSYYNPHAKTSETAKNALAIEGPADGHELQIKILSTQVNRMEEILKPIQKKLEEAETRSDEAEMMLNVINRVVTTRRLDGRRHGAKIKQLNTKICQQQETISLQQRQINKLERKLDKLTEAHVTSNPHYHLPSAPHTRTTDAVERERRVPVARLRSAQGQSDPVALEADLVFSQGSSGSMQTGARKNGLSPRFFAAAQAHADLQNAVEALEGALAQVDSCNARNQLPLHVTVHELPSDMDSSSLRPTESSSRAFKQEHVQHRKYRDADTEKDKCKVHAGGKDSSSPRRGNINSDREAATDRVRENEQDREKEGENQRASERDRGSASVSHVKPRVHVGRDVGRDSSMVDADRAHVTGPLRAKTQQQLLQPVAHADLEDVCAEKDSELIHQAYEDWHWACNAENAFGAFIHIAIHEGLGMGCYKCGLTLIICFVIQFTFAYELWYSMPALWDKNSGFCTNPGFLQLIACGVFLLIMASNVPQMMRSLLISLFSQRYLLDKNEMNVHHSLVSRLVIFIFGSCLEFLVWGMVLAAGFQWILTAADVNNIIRSTVSIAFVVNTDEMVYNACVPLDIQDSLTSARYHLRHNLLWCGIPDTSIYWLQMKYSNYIHLPLLFLAPCAYIMMMRTDPSLTGCQTNDLVFWNECLGPIASINAVVPDDCAQQ